ncbi:ribonuclease toxin immunity protein CdiI [Brevibacillus sp. HB2.2]|uniref:ribonuclease toxin immunity protein CdiI n=1 Tax=Brevibacillus sp. HB2.2 TaxID=2738846 RepID=UPI00156B707C|nr:ribonuclease toxin immunity protein CdiI [Brevibacillus sp. HB2.2]NRS51046.1 hypothetical protein [Brevibacillus sp. HB2.2]
MEMLLHSDDLFQTKHVPVQDLVNVCYLIGSFKNAVKYISTGIGFGTDMGGFTFWSDLDGFDQSFYEEEFIGIEVEFGSETIIVTYEILYDYFRIAAKRYVEKRPHDRKELERYFEDMRKNLNIE